MFDADEPFDGVLQVGVSGMYPASVDEAVTVVCDGVPVEVKSVALDHCGRVQVLRGGGVGSWWTM